MVPDSLFHFSCVRGKTLKSNSPISKDRINAYLFVIPAGITMFFLLIYPLCYGVFISFFNTNLVNRWRFTGLLNYVDTLKNSDFLLSIGRSFIFTFFVVSGHFILGFIYALALNTRVKYRLFFRALLLLPWLFPEVVVALLWKWLYNPNYGLFNGILLQLGIINEPVLWLSSSLYAFTAVILTCIWKGYPLVMIQVLAGLQIISADLYEAGMIDGCSKPQLFRHITLPGLKPVLMVTLILDTVWWFKHFTITWLLTSGGPGSSTMVASIQIYKQAFQFFEWGPAASAAAVVFVICVIIGLVYRRMLKK
jgi:multiple sugar transport system permease protein